MNRIPFKATLLLTVLLALASPFTGFAQSLPLTIANADEAKAAGSALAREILAQRPEENVTLIGALKIRAANGVRREVPVRFETRVSPGDWQTIYETTAGSNRVTLTVVHRSEQPSQYQLNEGGTVRSLAGNETTNSFAGSDFWVADLGLEFFHWPEQRLIKKEIRRSRSCRVLESVNPQPDPNGYARVVSWIDRETLGIVHGEAFDANDKLLKEFDPKEFKKVNGQWQLQEMEIRNVQTGSRTQIEFNLGQ